MSDDQQFESGYTIYYKSESTVVDENESVLQDVGEYVIAPQDRGHNPTSNELQTPERPRQSPRQVIQDEYDEDHYSIARPSTCPTERHGVLQNATLENQPTRKEGMFTNKNMKIAAVVLVCIVIIGGAIPLTILLTDQQGITNIFYFIWTVIKLTNRNNVCISIGLSCNANTNNIF